MSHFVVGVITKDGDTKEVERLLAPYHEFECTGRDDEFVQNVDKTEETRAEYESHKVCKYIDPLGGLHNPYDDRFYREPSPEEKSKVGLGTGGGNGLSWTSKDWRDGLGYRAKVHFLPDGWSVCHVPACECMTFGEYVSKWNGIPLTTTAELDLTKKHKYGYALINRKKEVVKVIDRTNPNRKWDWYVVGGRWKDWVVKGDVGPIADLKPNPERDCKNYFFALVTPEGEWVEKGRMGWWACVSDEKDDWPEIETKVLAKYHDYTVTVVDCHI